MDNYQQSLAVCIDCTENSESNLNDLLLTHLSMPPIDSSSVPSAFYIIDNNIQVRPFRLDTKYYTVDLGLCKLSSPTVGTEHFADRVEAVMFHMENASSFNQPEDSKFWLKTLESWLIYTKHWEPTVCMLIFDRIPVDRKQAVIVWCAKNEFELIELNPDEETLQETEDCGEVYGIHRIVQVLKAHSWPNLDLKDESVENEERSRRLRELLGEEEDDNVAVFDTTAPGVCNDDGTVAIATVLENKLKMKQESNACSLIDYKNHSKNVDSMLNVDDGIGVAIATEANGGEGSDGSSFEDLFAKFAAFKATAETMPENQRKQYAEKVTLAFWRAIGGDDDEIGGLDEDSGDEEAEI